MSLSSAIDPTVPAFGRYHVEVEVVGRGLLQRRPKRRQHLAALEVVDQRQQAARREDVDALGLGCLAALGRRADEAEPAGEGVDRRRHHAGDRRDAAVQRQLAGRDRQVEVAGLLLQVGRRQVHGDAALGSKCT